MSTQSKTWCCAPLLLLSCCAGAKAALEVLRKGRLRLFAHSKVLKHLDSSLIACDGSFGSFPLQSVALLLQDKLHNLAVSTYCCLAAWFKLNGELKARLATRGMVVLDAMAHIPCRTLGLDMRMKETAAFLFSHSEPHLCALVVQGSLCHEKILSLPNMARRLRA